MHIAHNLEISFKYISSSISNQRKSLRMDHVEATTRHSAARPDPLLGNLGSACDGCSLEIVTVRNFFVIERDPFAYDLCSSYM
jgi:hypothetical protein